MVVILDKHDFTSGSSTPTFPSATSSSFVTETPDDPHEYADVTESSDFAGPGHDNLPPPAYASTTTLAINQDADFVAASTIYGRIPSSGTRPDDNRSENTLQAERRPFNPMELVESRFKRLAARSSTLMDAANENSLPSAVGSAARRLFQTTSQTLINHIPPFKVINLLVGEFRSGPAQLPPVIGFEPYDPQSSSYPICGGDQQSSPILRPTNFLEIISEERPIHGTWLVDTSLQIPSSLLSPIAEGRIRPNIALLSREGPMHAEIKLAGGNERALLLLKNERGSVNLRLTNPRSQKVRIECIAGGGVVNILLPRTFEGPIVFPRRYGSSHFSTGILNSLVTLYERDGESKYFLGDLSTAQQTGEEQWMGDELYIEAPQAPILIAYLDEEMPISPSISCELDPTDTSHGRTQGTNALSTLPTRISAGFYAYHGSELEVVCPVTAVMTLSKMMAHTVKRRESKKYTAPYIIDTKVRHVEEVPRIRQVKGKLRKEKMRVRT